MTKEQIANLIKEYTDYGGYISPDDLVDALYDLQTEEVLAPADESVLRPFDDGPDAAMGTTEKESK